MLSEWLAALLCPGSAQASQRQSQNSDTSMAAARLPVAGTGPVSEYCSSLYSEVGL